MSAKPGMMKKQNIVDFIMGTPIRLMRNGAATDGDLEEIVRYREYIVEGDDKPFLVWDIKDIVFTDDLPRIVLYDRS